MVVDVFDFRIELFIFHFVEWQLVQQLLHIPEPSFLQKLVEQFPIPFYFLAVQLSFRSLAVEAALVSVVGPYQLLIVDSSKEYGF